MSTQGKKKQKLIGMLLGSGIMTIYSIIYAFMYSEGSFCASTSKFGIMAWCSSGPGTFFPFPTESGPFMATCRHESLIDYLMYVTVIETGLVYVIPLIFLGITLVTLWMFIQWYRTEKGNIQGLKSIES